jgi:hypothetical protein
VAHFMCFFCHLIEPRKLLVMRYMFISLHSSLFNLHTNHLKRMKVTLIDTRLSEKACLGSVCRSVNQWKELFCYWFHRQLLCCQLQKVAAEECLKYV